MSDEFQTINPATGEPIATYRMHSKDEATAAALAASNAFVMWRQSAYADRARILVSVAAQLRERSEPLARLMAVEMGKPLKQGAAEVEKCAWLCEHYASAGASYLVDEPVATGATESFVTFQPLGAILAVMPWNFPLWQAFRASVPALFAGNVMILKHAPNVAGSAAAIEEIYRKAGLPTGVFQHLNLVNDTVASLIGHPAIKGACLTGSTRAGKAVAECAGHNLKKTVLELGGSDPYVVLADADVDLAAEKCAASRMLNSGQSCIAAKRFIVVEPVVKAFVERFVEQISQHVVGNPLNAATTCGPMARPDLAAALTGQVEKSIAAGARKAYQSEAPVGTCFHPVVVLDGVTPGMAAFEEELFGPVASVIRAKDEAEALALANRSTYGLGGAVFTRDIVRGREIARFKIDTGTCAVNDMVKSDPRLPFGGIGESGYGRELGREGIREFTNIKTVLVG